MSKVIKIVRTEPRGGVPEEAVKNREGKYTLGDPADGNVKHRTEENGVFVDTLEEAADRACLNCVLFFRANPITP